METLHSDHTQMLREISNFNVKDKIFPGIPRANDICVMQVNDYIQYDIAFYALHLNRTSC